MGFDPAEFINQLLSGVITVAGVLVGAWLAFRLGVRQLRRERALDRRLEWHEKLVAAIQEYRSNADFLSSTFTRQNISTDERKKFTDYALKETTESGRRFKDILLRAELYGTSDEQTHAKRLFLLQLGIYVESWSAARAPKGVVQAASLDNLKEHTAELQREEQRLIQRLRVELEMVVQDRALKNGQSDVT